MKNTHATAHLLSTVSTVTMITMRGNDRGRALRTAGGLGVVLLLAGGAALAHPPVPASATPTVSWQKTPFGPEASPVHGDFSRGRHATLIRFSAGMKTPLHVHSNDYSGVVVSGTWRHPVPGQPEMDVELTPGATWFIPGGLAHVSECVSATPCVAVLIQDDKFDFKPIAK